MYSRIDLFGCSFAVGFRLPRLVRFFLVPFLIIVLPNFAFLFPPGPGFWKLNTSILEDDAYVESLSSFWRF